MVHGKNLKHNSKRPMDEQFAASVPVAQHDTDSERKKTNQYTLRISINFLLSTILFVCMISHGVGRFSATFAVLKLSDMYINRRTQMGVDPNQGFTRALPPPIYSNKKNIPITVYSSKHYDSGSVTTTETLLARRSYDDDPSSTNTETTLEADGSILEDSHNETLMSELHQPSGHHLLVDIKSVNGKFLNSEEMLAKAMIDLVEMSGLTMLSYHCHRLHPVGVSCVGVLLESHISLHTWPIPGAICLDLFTCGPNSLLPILPAIQRLFGVARIPAVHGSIVEKPFTQWAYKLRGFRNELPGKSAGDIGQFLHGWLEYDMKEKVVSVDTKYQKIEIYDVINPRFNSLHFYKASLLNDGSYEASNPELFRPDRVVYLDGILQSRYFGDAAYHEALVHPALFSHPNPKRVAIIGGGEGATLREVLKHNTIETVTMIEIDEEMVNISKQYLPEWSDCSMILGSTPSCFDDPRAEVIYADAIDWMTERFADTDRVRLEDLYDVIIIDAVYVSCPTSFRMQNVVHYLTPNSFDTSDPMSIAAFSDVLYGHEGFIRSLSNALGESGVLISQFGEDVKFNTAGAQVSPRITEYDFMEKLKDYEFIKIEDYSEGHGGFLGVMKFKIAFKCGSCFTQWHASQAKVDLAIKKRSMPTVEGIESKMFRFFDGATMMGYQYPSRVVENVFCREIPTPSFCGASHGFDPYTTNVNLSRLEVKASLIPNAGRGVFTTIDISKGSLIGLEEVSRNVIVMPDSVHLIRMFLNKAIVNLWKMFDAYLYGLGFSSDFFFDTSYSIDNGILQFLNHGCNGTNNLQNYNITEFTADPTTMPEEFDETFESTIYNPFVSRSHLNLQNCGDPLSNKDVKAGEELLDLYLSYYTPDTWTRGISDLRAQCSAQALGSVGSYEQENV